MALSHSAVLALKRAYYGRRGEPYRIAGHTLHFVPGTRPTRLRYVTAEERVTRYDALELALLSERLKPGQIVADVGAHVGAMALVMAACVGASGRVTAFEPDPSSRAVMERNIALNPHVRRPLVEPLAASDKAGAATFFSDGGESNSSLQLAATGCSDNAQALQVEMITLDGYDFGGVPDWVKMDIEGAEIAALRGAARLLAGPTNFVVELHPYAWPAFGDTWDDLRAIVAASGRRMRYLDEVAPLTADPIYGVVLLER